jgi:hypothetical protein
MSACLIQDCTEAPFARYVCAPTGHSVLLCQRHLDMWLDDPYMEPAELTRVGG